MSTVKVVHKTKQQLLDERDDILAVLGMTLEQARSQWMDCGCCLVDGNWHDYEELQKLNDIEFLLGDA